MFILGIMESQSAAAAGDFESIATVSLTGSQTAIDFTSIGGTYQHLQLRVLARSTTAGTAQDEIQLQVGNGSIDTASNYSYHFLYGNGTSPVASAGTSTSYVRIGFAPRASATSNSFSGTVIDFLDYSNTNKYKTFRSLGGADLNDTNGIIALCSGNWRNTAAITHIRLKPESGNSFPVNSYAALYGIKG